MKHIKSALLITWILGVACRDHPSALPSAKNDTTLILEESIRYGLSVRYMPDADALHIKYKFGDSVLLTSEKLSLNLLPSVVDGQSFKILPLVELCNMIRRDSLKDASPNVLVIYEIQKNDSGYSALLASRSCLKFGGGGVLSLEFKKLDDSLMLVHRSASSVN